MMILKKIIRNIAQKMMANPSFGGRFHDLKYVVVVVVVAQIP